MDDKITNQKSSQDKAGSQKSNSGNVIDLANKANSAYTNYKDMRRIAKIIRKAKAIWFSPAFNVIIFICVLCSFVAIVSGFVGGGGGGGTAVGANPPGASSSATFTFVALGDSLTAWPCDPVTYGCVDSNPWGSYHFTGNPWPTYLTTDDPNLKLLHNAGYPAQTTAYMLQQEPGVLSAYHPDILFVLGGTNDLLNGGISEQQTIANLKSIISTAQSSTYGVKKVIVLTIPNQCNGANTTLNADIIADLSSLAPVIDISETSSLSLICGGIDVQISDNLHLTDAGAKKVADYIDGQITSRNLLPTQPAQTQPLNMVFYCQWSTSARLGGGAWASYMYTDGEIKATGCGPTSMAMIISSFGNKILPNTVADAFTADGMRYWSSELDAYNGTALWSGKNPTAIKAWIASFGLKASDMNLENGGSLEEQSIENLFNQQGKSYLLWANIENYIADSNPVARGGHEVVITAC